ncbi:MAG: hypothetical protein J6B31_04815 [Bacteroidaceae bacterium]|nr:hypothetical protein [Bacteroidaceae bacterium]
MKKYISMFFIALSVSFTSCDTETDEEPGGTAVEKMAGTWTVTFEQSVDEYNAIFNGGSNPNLESMSAEELAQQNWADIYDTGKVSIMTSNTAANIPTEMWFIDNEFWGTQVKCNVNYDERTFSCDAQTAYEDCVVDIIGGKVLEGAATTPRGVPADSIIAYIKYSDDYYGFTFMKVSGYRYTGYTEDR